MAEETKKLKPFSQIYSAVSIIELDINGDLLAWSYPHITKNHDAVIRARSGIKTDSTQFRFSKYKNEWQYFQSFPVSKQNSKVLKATVCIISQTYNPAKFAILLNMFGQLYLEECTPLPVLQVYLSIFISGKAETKQGTFTAIEWDDRRAFISPVKKIFELFGIETILIWVAMITRKRVFVYADRVDDLQALIRSFPLIGSWHRQNWDILRPFVNLNDLELLDLKDSGVYVAGFTDSSCVNYKEMYDLFVDVTSKSCTVNDSARADFALAKFHKELITGFLKSSAEDTDQNMIKAMAVKTKELLANLETFKVDHSDGKYVTLEDLQRLKLPANMDRFLFNVASAEGMGKP